MVKLVKRPKPKTQPFWRFPQFVAAIGRRLALTKEGAPFTPLQFLLAFILAGGLAILFLYGLCKLGDVFPRKGFWRDHDLDQKLHEASLQRLEHEHCGIEPTLTLEEIYNEPDTSGDDPVARRKAEKELLPAWALRRLAKWRAARGEDEAGDPINPTAEDLEPASRKRTEWPKRYNWFQTILGLNNLDNRPPPADLFG